MNNGYLGMVRQWQELFWDKRYSHVDMGQFPDFVKLAEAYGATGMRLDGQDDARRRHAARRSRRRAPCWSTSASPREENVYPMIARRPGRAGHGGLSAWASRNQGAPVPRGAGGRRRACAPAASTSCRSSSRTSRAS